MYHTCTSHQAWHYRKAMEAMPSVAPRSWPWRPFKSFPLTSRFSNGSALCKVKMALSSQTWNSRPATCLELCQFLPTVKVLDVKFLDCKQMFIKQHQTWYKTRYNYFIIIVWVCRPVISIGLINYSMKCTVIATSVKFYDQCVLASAGRQFRLCCLNK